MKHRIDMRSDIVTRPTEEMRRAMYEAEVGDDGAREDPTTERLQELAADRLGKEAALFATSGTQGNLLGLLSQVDRGDVIVGPERIHVEYAEKDGYRRIGGVSIVTTPSDGGVAIPGEIRGALERLEETDSRARLLWLENTHNMGGGSVTTPQTMAEIRVLADEFRLRVHVDGSRIFNAATYLGVDVCELTRHADTVQICLSKGLAAPIGSLLVGPRETIAQARELRWMLGSQMRQVGVIAAAGIVAIEKMSTRLQEDHDNARLLAEGLAQIPGIELDFDEVQTNLVYCSVDSSHGTAQEVCARLKEEGVFAGGGGLGPQSIRFVLHYEVSYKDVQEALEAIKRVMGEL